MTFTLYLISYISIPICLLELQVLEMVSVFIVLITSKVNTLASVTLCGALTCCITLFCFPKTKEDSYSTAGQKITSLLSKDILFYLCLMGSDFVSADEPHYLRDNEQRE